MGGLSPRPKKLKKASKMHLAQAKKIEAHIKAMEKMAKKKK